MTPMNHGRSDGKCRPQPPSQPKPSHSRTMDHALVDIIEDSTTTGFLGVTSGDDPGELPTLPHSRRSAARTSTIQRRAERTAEVPHALTFPENTANEETTGVTNTASIQPALLTGLWAAVLVGMLGAMIMLLLVWGIIGGVS